MTPTANSNSKKISQLVVSGLMALLFVNFYLKAKEKTIENSYGMVDVLAAAKDIPPHTALTPAYITIKQVPLKFVEPGAVPVKILDQSMKRVMGKVTVAAVQEGAQLVMANLKDPAPSTSGIAPLLPPGKRGYLLRLGNLDVAELILPGDRIDIMATFTIKDSQKQSKATYTILQNIMVVGVGKYLKKPNEGVTEKREQQEGLVLTLALEPTEAERLNLAQIESQGEISVTVRAHGDQDTRPIPGITPSHLLNSPVSDPHPPPVVEKR